MKRKGQRGFSLIELGIVVAVIAILATVVLVGRGFLESSRVSKIVEIIDTMAKGTAVYAGSNGGIIPPTGALTTDLEARELLKAGVGASVPGFTITLTRAGPETLQVVITCAVPASCEDICNAKSRDSSQVGAGACAAGANHTMVFQI